MPPRKTESTSNEPQEWKEGQRRGREARRGVAEALSVTLIERDTTGSEGLAITRVREVAEAKATGDATLVRAAVFEASLAFAQWAVSLDAARK